MKKLTLITLILLTLNSILLAQVNLDSLLTSYWPFSGNANDESGNGNDGIIYGPTLTSDRFGNDSSAFDFDGVNDYIETETTFDNIILPLSISAWIYKSNHGPNHEVIFISHDHPSNYYGFWLSILPDTNITISYGDGGPSTSNSRRSKRSDVTIPLESWTHIVAIIQGPDDMSIYFNNEEVSGYYEGSGGNIQNISTPAKIGLAVEGSNYWDGKIDDVRVYNRALTTEEVDSLFNEEFISSINEFGFSKYELEQNFPNPCKVSTNIPYYIQEKGIVTLKVYNALGIEIQSISTTTLIPGNYSINLNTENYSTGIYFYKMEINDFVQMRKMLIEN